MVRVEGRFNENIEKLIRRFKKACQREGVNLKQRQDAFRYVKPSQRRRLKLNAARRAQQKEINLAAKWKAKKRNR